MSNQIISYGASLERSLNGTSGWADIPEAKGVAVPSTTQEYPEVTSLDSPNGFREYIKGLKDAGEIELECGYTAAGYEQQVADNAAAGAIYYRVTLKPAPNQSSGDIFAFRGFPTPQLVDNGLGEPLGMTLRIRITGDVTWTKGAAVV
ncbi:phage tail tube protein [uncultured Amaricoccus sp.]|uniref:phage tail tube protein n=1 Tax=uncultured Amaricoccus sp. TaxID=339341 RepID=UPI002606D8A2|nr:phage tail tube protein [uncultured Amaricoccus sp.]